MKAGQVVTYVDGTGRARDARVVAVGGSGPSNFKILDLEVPGVSDGPLVGCRHEYDRTPGEGYWTLDPRPVIALEDGSQGLLLEKAASSEDQTVTPIRKSWFRGSDPAA